MTVVGGRHVSGGRGSLRAHEAAFLLGCTRRDVRNMLRRGDLRAVHAGRTRCVDVAEVAARLAGDPLALEVLSGIVEGRLVAPPLASLDTPPSSLTYAIEGP